MEESLEMRRRLGKSALAALLGFVLSSSSGCALLWLGVGGAGGYLIRKGEEGNSSPQKATSSKEPAKKSE